jgi:hypothetical protein
MANEKLKVTFIKLEVHKDGDAFGRGEIYYSFK